ncbi:alanine racemase [Sinosporangium siamense]|uniref:Diaminopimelate decarboxylase n=1 Tax=Sinosporangium siamense TaxID=1367973 RepID=A0A919V5I2_9ACTN|nr:alanine racemase [Sinosporangium siamense]GII93045.1 diaminopimelate decarboxylase [Sinosporangium siamense]
MIAVPSSVRAAAGRLRDFPAYVYDLAALSTHMRAVRSALPGVELYYAAKANPDPALLTTLAPHVDGFEVSSGGELAHVRSAVPGARLAFGGPGKTDDELAAAAGAHRVHVESPGELRRLLAMGVEADVLLRVNLDIPVAGASLAMGGGATPFGMDPAGIDECLTLLSGHPGVRLRGVHAHLASGLEAGPLVDLAGAVLGYARGLGVREVNVGGGMAVAYTEPSRRFDWEAYGKGLTGLIADGERVRIEPGRALTVYCGWYLTRVIDVKRVHGELFAVVAGGTHHLRTPVTKGHDQPFAVLDGAGGPGEPVTVVGQLCTPKDVLARRAGTSVRVGDVLAFGMAGAYAWNISHHEFLLHPKPKFFYV